MTRCIILAAGCGTRLRPMTDDRPKCLVPLLGKPLLHHQIDLLQRSEIDAIAIVTGYLSEKIEKLGKIEKFEFTIFKNDLYDSTNMVESLFLARTFMKGSSDDLLISYGDIVYERKNLEAVIKDDADLSVMIDYGWYDLWSLRNENPLNDAETLKIDENGFIRKLGKKPKTYDEIDGQYTGLLKVAAHKIDDFIYFYDQLDRNKYYDGTPFHKIYLTSFLQLLIDAGWKIKGVPVTHGWLEVDTIEDLTLYEKLEQQQQLKKIWNPYA